MISRRKLLSGSIKIAISVALVSYLIYSAYSHDQFDILLQGGVDPLRYAAALALAFLAILLTFVRWFFLVRGLGIPLKLWDAMRFGFVSYFFNFATVGTVGGDALRAFFVAKENPDRRTESIATVVVDRLIGLIALFTLTGTVLMTLNLQKLCGDDQVMLGILETCRWVSVVSATIGNLGLGLLCLFRYFRNWKIWPALFRLPGIGGLTRRLYNAGMVYSNRPLIVAGAYLGSFPVHILNSVSVFLVATSLPIAHPTLLMHLAAVPLSALAGVLPLPGGIGAFEGMLAVLYRAMAETPMAAEHGLLVAFGFRVITLIIASVGVVIYLAERKEIDQLQAENEELNS